MSESTAVHTHVARGAFAAVGPKIGMIEKTITWADLTSTSIGNSVQAIIFDTPVLLLACGINQTTACDTSVTLSLGDAEDGTTYVNGQAADTTGQLAIAGPAAPVLKAAASQLSVTVGGAAATTGVSKVWVLFADIGDFSG